MEKFSRRWVPHSLSDAQKVAGVEAAKEMLRILHESEVNDFDGIATGDESWFQHITASSKIFTRSGADVIPRTQSCSILQGKGSQLRSIPLCCRLWARIGELSIYDALPSPGEIRDLETKYLFSEPKPEFDVSNEAILLPLIK
jgi:hypothetical protein